MRIILANKYFYPRGGDCVHTISLKNLLEKNGHKVAVFSMQHPENLKNEYDAYWPSEVDFNSKNILNYKKSILRPFHSNEVKNKWNRLVSDFQPDIIHLHNIHSQLSPILAEEAFKKDLPVFWTLHDYKLICPDYSMLREGKPCELCIAGKKNVVKHRCLKNNLIGSFIAYMEALKWNQQKLEKYTTQFIAPSVFLKNMMIRAGFCENKISHIYNFIETEKFKPITKKEDYYVYVGRLSEEKGIATLLKTAEKLKNFKIKVFGNGPLKKKLEKYFKQPHISFMGYKPWDVIKEEIGKAKFLVLPSECYENNPLSIIEAFALGTPVLGSDIGGIPEMIIPCKNGLLFKPDNEENLKIKINEMMATDNWNYAAISEDAKKIFNRNRYYKKITDLYAM